jgi:hypothetical protein
MRTLRTLARVAERLYHRLALSGLALGWLLVGFGVAFGLDKAPTAAALSRQATALYRKKNYEAACPLFQQVTELTPERGAAWGDYGLCLARLGQPTAAVAATYKAIGLAGSDRKTRKAGYHNLAAILDHPFPSHIPGPTEEGTLAELEGVLPRCEIFDPVPGCDQRVWGCFSDGLRRGGLARFARDPRTIAQKPWPESNPWVDQKTILDKDVLVLGDGAAETFRSGLTICRAGISCTVVWADACNARIGYECEVSIGNPDYETIPADAVDVPCTSQSIESGELTIQ